MDSSTTNMTDTTWNHALARTLRAARKRRKLTLRQTARLVGAAMRTIACYEQGDRRPDARRLLELAIHLNIDLNELAKQAINWSHPVHDGQPDAPTARRP